MDATDLRILRAMGLRPFESWPRDPGRFRPGHLAMQAGVSPETVKARLSRMHEDGVLAGYEIYPNARHLGFQQTTFHLHVSDELKTTAMDDLRLMEGLVSIFEFLGPDLCVDLCYRNDGDLERKLGLVSRLTRQEDIVRFYDRVLPGVKKELTHLDWRIIKSMRGDARRPLDEIAKEVGVSTRTVRRRHAAMEAEGAFDIVAVMNLGLVEELSVFNLVFFLDDPTDRQTMARIQRAFDDRFLYAWQPPSLRFGSYHVTVFARNNAEMEANRRRGAAIEGVERCEVMIPSGVHHHEGWLDEAIEARLNELSPNRTPTPDP